MADGILPIRFSRRSMLKGAGAGLALIAAPATLRQASAQSWTANPFSLGVASGAPRPDGFVLWTRLAPDPMSTDPERPGGMSGGTGDMTIAYEIATDEAMANIVRRGGAVAEKKFAHSVHLDVAGLQS